jgi:hypothetical protein
MSGLRDVPRHGLVVRAAFLGVTAVVLAARGIPAYRVLLQEEQASTAELRQQLHQARASVATRSRTSEMLEAASRRFGPLSDSLLREGSLAAAGASLAAVFSDAVAAAGAQMSALQIQSDSVSSPGVQWVAVSGSLTADVSGLMSIISMLETGMTRVRIRQLSIVQPDASGDPGQPEALQVQLLVDALAWIGPPPGSS